MCNVFNMYLIVYDVGMMIALTAEIIWSGEIDLALNET